MQDSPKILVEFRYQEGFEIVNDRESLGPFRPAIIVGAATKGKFFVRYNNVHNADGTLVEEELDESNIKPTTPKPVARNHSQVYKTRSAMDVLVEGGWWKSKILEQNGENYRVKRLYDGKETTTGQENLRLHLDLEEWSWVYDDGIMKGHLDRTPTQGNQAMTLTMELKYNQEVEIVRNKQPLGPYHPASILRETTTGKYLVRYRNGLTDGRIEEEFVEANINPATPLLDEKIRSIHYTEKAVVDIYRNSAWWMGEITGEPNGTYYPVTTAVHGPKVMMARQENLRLHMTWVNWAWKCSVGISEAYFDTKTRRMDYGHSRRAANNPNKRGGN